MTGTVERLYETFAPYPLPADLAVCEQCGPQWSVTDLRKTSLRSLSLLQLEAVHVIALDDNGLRHFFPRLIELLRGEHSPAFAFDLSRLKGRMPSWPQPEATAVTAFVDDLWHRLLSTFPADLGYFSDSPTLIDFTYWCDCPLQPHLDRWLALDSEAAAQHLAELVQDVLTGREPAEPALRPMLREWLRRPAVGERLLAANCEAALELWAL